MRNRQMILGVSGVDRFHKRFGDFIPGSAGADVIHLHIEAIHNRVISLVNAVVQEIAGFGFGVVWP